MQMPRRQSRDIDSGRQQDECLKHQNRLHPAPNGRSRELEIGEPQSALQHRCIQTELDGHGREEGN